MAYDAVARPVPQQYYALTSAMGGATQGFVTVTLGYVLVAHGFSVATVAGIVALRMFPETWRVLFGPILDLSLNPRLWFIASALAAAVCVGVFAIVPLEPRHSALIGLLALAIGIFANCGIVAQVAAIGVTTRPKERGRIAGWSQSGNLCGVGLGGGAGLWLATHVGMGASATAIAGWCLVCCAPMLVIRTPRPDSGAPLGEVLGGLRAEVVVLAATRNGLLAILAVTLPMGLGSFLSLLSAVAGDWHASADLTASTTGVLAGLASVPGCLIGGYFCHRHPPQIVLACSAMVCALGELAMALGPRSPAAFVFFTLLGNALLGVAWAAVAAIIFVALRGRGGGTIGALLGSLCNLPVVAVTFLLGVAQPRYGSTGMMTIEAMLGIGSAIGYGLVASLWRADRRGQPALA
jgi:hypothetical protein